MRGIECSHAARPFPKSFLRRQDQLWTGLARFDSLLIKFLRRLFPAIEAVPANDLVAD